MSEISCITIGCEEFLKKLDVLLLEKKNAIIIMVFLPIELRIAQQLSKDDEEKLILDGWQHFCQNFPFICYCTRLGWSDYLILLEQESSEILKVFNKVFNDREEYLYFNLWRIAFTELKNSKERTRILMGEFDTIASKAAHYNPSEKLFHIHLHGKVVFEPPLNWAPGKYFDCLQL